MTPSEASRMKHLIRERVKAEIANASKGAQHPDDIPYIEQDLKVARKKLKDFINSLVQGA
jgi:hypothetical protein